MLTINIMFFISPSKRAGIIAFVLVFPILLLPFWAKKESHRRESDS